MRNADPATAVGRVFSPQYLVWLVAVMACALTVAPAALRWPAGLLAVTIVLAHLVYPAFYYDYMGVQGWAVLLGLLRNLCLLAAGLGAVRAAWGFQRPAVDQRVKTVGHPS